MDIIIIIVVVFSSHYFIFKYMIAELDFPYCKFLFCYI